MPTKPRTKKPAAKPQRKTRAVRETATDAIARNVADALGRRLDDLLSVKQGTAVEAFQDSNATDAPTKSISHVEEAVVRLLGAVYSSECLTDTTADRLKAFLAPPTTTTGAAPICGPEPFGSSEFAARLNEIADRIYVDGRRRLDILNRLEI